MLPFEDRAQQDVEADHHNDLVESRELLQLALDMIGSDGRGNLRIPAEPVLGVTDQARSLALGLYAKACKQFRSIIILAERGFRGEVTVLTRSLFETTLAMNFIMNESVALKRDGKAFDPDPSRPLTTDLRALLYGAHAVFTEAKRSRQWSERPELKSSMGLRVDPKVIAAQTAAAKTAVGEKWWEALKGGQAGLSVRNLADSLGVFSYYLMVYGDQSEVAHAGDGFMHFDLEDDGEHGSLDLSPSPVSIGGLLQLACLVFLGALTGIHNRLKFGDAVDKKLDAFAARLGVPTDK
jgi:Family of unknown function (DUF5677)